MRLQLRSLVAAVSLIFANCFQLQAIDIYVLSGASIGNAANPINFGKIDSTTGAYTNIKSGVSGSNVVANLAWNSAISAFYVTENTSISTNLRTLDTLGTLSSQIGTTIGKTIYGMAYRPTDTTLYAYDYITDGTGKISPTAGGWSILNSNAGISSSAPYGGRYTIHNDTIYMAIRSGNSQFGTIGFTNTSTFSQIGSKNSLYSYMVLASDGTTLYGLYGDGTSGAQKLYSINPTNGATTFLTNVSGAGLGEYFYGAGIASVPEPSTYALAAIATGVMAAVARRRKARKA